MKQLNPFIFYAGILACAVSCMNEDYDLTRKIDTTIGIKGEIGVPVGSTKFISLSDLFTPEENSAIKIEEASGNYHFLAEEMNMEYTIPRLPDFSLSDAISLEKFSMFSMSRAEIIGAYLPEYAGLDWQSVPVPKGKEIGIGVKKGEIAIGFEQDIPEGLVDIRTITEAADIIINVHTSRGNADVKGLRMEFPKWLMIDSNVPDIMEFDSNSGILTIKDISINGSGIVGSDGGYRLGLRGIDFSKLPEGQGIDAKAHKIVLNGSVGISETVISFLPDQFGQYLKDIPDNLEASVSISVESLGKWEIEAKVRPQVSIADQSVILPELPEFFQEGELVLDIHNPGLHFNVMNRSQYSISLNADIFAEANGERKSVHLGDNGKDDATAPVTIDSHRQTEVNVSRLGSDRKSETSDTKVLDIAAEGLSKLFMQYPDKVGISNIELSCPDTWQVYTPEDNDAICISGTFAFGIAAGENFMLQHPFELTGLGKGLSEGNIEKVTLKFRFVNSIPLNLELSAVAIDGQGCEIPGITIDFNSKVGGGTAESPATSDMSIQMTASDGSMKQLDGLRFMVKATGMEGAGAGVNLNTNQGFRFEDIKLIVNGEYVTEL